ncbi:MAG: rhomboid family intramembrane serine protease [Acidobacteria bacterium]|nr:rhomboid family intramembrane serine protease [Acidobacteriota bacterium]
MWIIRALDTFRTVSVLGYGIIPRTPSHLFGIVTAPFIHASWAHLLANTLPLLVLGGLILVGGTSELAFVTVVCGLASGLGTFLFGSMGNHIGASGIVFGYIGYLLVRPAYDRRVWSLVVTLLVIGIYGTTLLLAITPQAGVSWSGHAFGFVGGMLAARWRKYRR